MQAQIPFRVDEVKVEEFAQRLQSIERRVFERLVTIAAQLGIDPLEHYMQHGRAEGRAIYQAVGRDIAGGFEGPHDGKKHRGGKEGWKADDLPWIQD